MKLSISLIKMQFRFLLEGLIFATLIAIFPFFGKFCVTGNILCYILYPIFFIPSILYAISSFFIGDGLFLKLDHDQWELYTMAHMMGKEYVIEPHLTLIFWLIFFLLFRNIYLFFNKKILLNLINSAPKIRICLLILLTSIAMLIPFNMLVSVVFSFLL